MRRTPLKRVSRKREKEGRIYAARRKDFLEELPVCEVCADKKSTDVHHRLGRGKYYLDKATWLSVCRSCHERIHAEPKWSRENGYLLDRMD